VVEILQQANRRECRVTAPSRLEFQRLNQLGRKLTERQVAVGSTMQRIFVGEIGEFFDFALNTKQLHPADGFIDDDEAVPFAFLCRAERFDRVMEQSHETADTLRAGDIAPFLGFSCPREQASDQLVRHVEYSVSETGFEINQSCHQNRASPVRGIAADLMRVRYATFSDDC